MAISFANKPGLVIYFTAGDPDLPTTRDMALAAPDAGADVIELGVPFSDPLADGPVIQRASERAVARGTRLGDVLETCAEIRAARPEAGIILFSYLNPVVRFGLQHAPRGSADSSAALRHGDQIAGRNDSGNTDSSAPPANGNQEKQRSDAAKEPTGSHETNSFEAFVKAAKEAGADGVLLTDMIVEEAGEYLAAMREHGLAPVFLAAPTSPDTRLKAIAEATRGFVYAISRVGITGTQTELAADARGLVERIKQFTDLPVALGFGVSTAEHVRAVSEFADAAVVGSAIVALVEKTDRDEAAAAVGRFVRELKSGVAP